MFKNKKKFSFGKNQAFAKHSVNVNNDGSKRFKGSDTVSQDDFVQMIKEYPCLYDKSFMGKTDLQTQRLKKHAWQEIAKITDRNGKFSSNILFVRSE